MANTIYFYYQDDEPYGIFSNFRYCNPPIKFQDKEWITSEHIFQAYKFINCDNPIYFNQIYMAKTPTIAAKLGRDKRSPLRSDWNDIKDDLMEQIVYAKFSQNESFKKVLLETGNKILVEHTRNDNYWADGGNGSGLNMLGKILMKVRDRLQSTIPQQITITKGKLYNGRMEYKNGAIPSFIPSLHNTTSIFVMIRTNISKNEYGCLSPYFIKVPVNGYPDGVIHENFWQFSKVYPVVPKVNVPFSTNNPKIVWSHPEEIHFDGTTVLPKWFEWNKKGFESQDYIRFPVGSDPKNRRSCLFSLIVNEDGSIDTSKKLNYVEARKQIYAKHYIKNVINHEYFRQLQQRLYSGENLLIIEIDGPHYESSKYYQYNYGWPLDTIYNGTIEALPEYLKILINDTRHPFGHGYCLSMALLGNDVIEHVLN